MEASDESVADEFSDERLARELGPEAAGLLSRIRDAQLGWDIARYPGEGLRERKKRMMRQRISDVATALFITRGFDQVKVSEVAEIVGVSEKTVYNYFPTKESLVLDQADEQAQRMAQALLEREPGEPPTRVVVNMLEEESARFEAVTDEIAAGLPAFAEMVATTPSLRAAWNDHRQSLVHTTRDVLASSVDVGPDEPEPLIAAHALVALWQVQFEAISRHILAGKRGRELRDAVDGDVRRAARLLETGLWSFNLLAQGARSKQQFVEAAKAADNARKQVRAALREARRAWHELRAEQRESERG